jgi:hypothetical protein
MRLRTKAIVLAFAFFVVGYLLVYFVLSRRGYIEADELRFSGFYYLSPEDSNTWRRGNELCVRFFQPVNFIDRAVGLGRHPASEPLFRLSEPSN